MSRLRLLICIAAASLLAVGVAACGGETKTVTEEAAGLRRPAAIRARR